VIIRTRLLLVQSPRTTAYQQGPRSDVDQIDT
jgi:hypothetical protein